MLPVAGGIHRRGRRLAGFRVRDRRGVAAFLHPGADFLIVDGVDVRRLAVPGRIRERVLRPAGIHHGANLLAERDDAGDERRSEGRAALRGVVVVRDGRRRFGRSRRIVRRRRRRRAAASRVVAELSRAVGGNDVFAGSGNEDVRAVIGEIGVNAVGVRRRDENAGVRERGGGIPAGVPAVAVIALVPGGEDVNHVVQRSRFDGGGEDPIIRIPRGINAAERAVFDLNGRLAEIRDRVPAAGDAGRPVRGFRRRGNVHARAVAPGMQPGDRRSRRRADDAGVVPADGRRHARDEGAVVFVRVNLRAVRGQLLRPDEILAQPVRRIRSRIVRRDVQILVIRFDPRVDDADDHALARDAFVPELGDFDAVPPRKPLPLPIDDRVVVDVTRGNLRRRRLRRRRRRRGRRCALRDGGNAESDGGRAREKKRERQADFHKNGGFDYGGKE